MEKEQERSPGDRRAGIQLASPPGGRLDETNRHRRCCGNPGRCIPGPPIDDDDLRPTFLLPGKCRKGVGKHGLLIEGRNHYTEFDFQWHGSE